MAHPQIATFARLANGNAKPIRKIEGQKTLLGRTMHAIGFDPINDEFTIPQPFAQAILTFRAGASGEEPPLRVIQGPSTRLKDPNRLDVDPVHGEILVAQEDAVLVFAREANGDVAPLRILAGPKTQFGRAGARSVTTDPVRNLLVAVGPHGRNQAKFLIFDRTAHGDVAPLRVIGGPQHGPRTVSAPFLVYPPKGWIVASDRGTGGRHSDDSYIGVWDVEDGGDAPPKFKIGGPQGIFRFPVGLTLDSNNKEVIVSDKWLNAVLIFYVPELF